MDGLHGGQTIKIPSITEIVTAFKPFIDERWHIKSVDSASAYYGKVGFIMML